MSDMARTNDAIQNAIEGAFAGMDSRGFFPAHPCKKCGKPLQGADSGRPAELYAGTYTGLCYPCQNGDAFLVSTDPDSAAQTWSHPPHCPSWRREREEKLWFPDCKNTRCEHGRVWVSRAGSQGGSYTVQCEDCWKRHAEHPVIALRWARDKRLSDLDWDWRCRMRAEYVVRRANLKLPEGETTPEQKVQLDKLRAAVFAEGPTDPTDPDVEPVFPEGWALPETEPKVASWGAAPKARKARRKKS